MKNWKLEYLLLALLGVLLGCSQRYLGHPVSAFFGVFFCLALALALRKLERIRYASFFLFGMVLHLVALPWMPGTIQLYGEFSYLFSLAATLLLFALASIQFLVFNFLHRRLQYRKVEIYCLSLPLAWFAADVLIPKFLPWTLGYTLSPFPIFLQIADIGGISFVGLFLLWWADSLLAFFRAASPEHQRQISYRARLLLPISLAAVLGYGFLRTNMVETALKAAPTFPVAIIQGNLDPAKDFTSERTLANIEKHTRLTKQALQQTPAKLVLWPESSVGHDYFKTDNEIAPKSPRDPYPSRRQALIFGGQTRMINPITKKSRYHNSAFLLEPSGKLTRYNKQQLFPFSEYLPLGSFFPSLADFIEMNYIMDAGKNETPLLLNLPETRRAPIPVATVICYEDTIPSHFSQMVKHHAAELLVVLTNDNWFAESVASRQHFTLSIVRAIENRRFFVRAATHGVSAVISPTGQILTELPAFKEAADVVEVKPLSMWSFYPWLGEIPAVLCGLLIVLLGLLPQKIKHKPKQH